MSSINRVRVLLKNANDCSKRGQSAAALAHVDNALLVDSVNVSALKLKASLLIDLHEYAESEATLQFCLQLVPDDVVVWSGFAKLFEITQNIDHQVYALEKIKTLGTGRMEMYICKLAACYAKQGAWKAAIDELMALEPTQAVLQQMCDILEPLYTYYQPQARAYLSATADPMVEIGQQLVRCSHMLFTQTHTMEDAARLMDVALSESMRIKHMILKQTAKNLLDMLDYLQNVLHESATLIVADSIPLVVGYRVFLDTFDCASIASFPRDVMEFYVLNFPCDDYAIAMQWILEGTPAEGIPQYSAFASFVTALLTTDFDVCIEAARICTKLAQSPRMVAKAKMTLANALLASGEYASVEPIKPKDSAELLIMAGLNLNYNLAESKTLFLQARKYRMHMAWISSCVLWIDFLMGRNVRAQFEGISLTHLVYNTADSYVTRHRIHTHLYRLGTMYRTSDPNISIDCFTRALAYLGQSLNRYLPGSDTLFQLAELSTPSEKYYMQAIHINPQNYKAADALSACYINKKEKSSLHKAYELLLCASEYSPDQQFIWSRLSFLSLQLGLIKYSERLFHKALEFGPNINLTNGLAHVFIESGKFNSALKILKDGNEMTNYLMAKAYIKLRKFEHAEGYINNFGFMPMAILAGDYYFLYARECFNKNLFTKCAETIAKGLVVLNDENTHQSKATRKRTADLLVAWTWVPHFNNLIESLKKACDIYTELKLYGNAARTNFELYKLSKDRLLLGSAKDFLKISLKEDDDAYCIAGAVFAALGEPALAQHCLVSALNRDSRLLMAWNNLGIVYEQNSDFDLAKRCYERAITCDPYYFGSLIGRARLTNIDSCEHGVRDAMTLGCEGMDPRYLYSFAQIAVHQNKYLETAEECLFKYMEWDPRNSDAWNLLGCIYERESKLELAQHAYKNALTHSLKNSSAVQNYARVLAVLDPEQSLRLLASVPCNSKYSALSRAMATKNDPKLAADLLGMFSSESHAPAIRLFVAQVCYKLGGIVHDLLRNSPETASALCALGITQDNEEFVRSSLKIMTPIDKNHFLCIFDLSQHPEGRLSHRYLQRNVHLEPWNPIHWNRLHKHFLQYFCSTIDTPATQSCSKLNISGLLVSGKHKLALRQVQSLMHMAPNHRNLFSICLLANNMPHLIMPLDNNYGNLISSEKCRQKNNLKEALAFVNKSSGDACEIQKARIHATMGDYLTALELTSTSFLGIIEKAQYLLRLNKTEECISLLKTHKSSINKGVAMFCKIVLFMITSKPIKLAQEIIQSAPCTSSKYAQAILALGLESKGEFSRAERITKSWSPEMVLLFR